MGLVYIDIEREFFGKRGNLFVYGRNELEEEVDLIVVVFVSFNVVFVWVIVNSGVSI